MRAMVRKLALGSAAVLCLASTAACGDANSGSDNTATKQPTVNPASPTPRPEPPKPRGPVLQSEWNDFPYTAQVVSATTSYERPDGTPVSPDGVYLRTLMVVKGGLEGRAIQAPATGNVSLRVNKEKDGVSEWGTILEPVTNYFPADQVNAAGEGVGPGVEGVGRLEAGTSYYVTWGVALSKDLSLSDRQLCEIGVTDAQCIPLGKVDEASSS